MTLRAIVIGLLLGLSIAALGYLNDFVLNQSFVASDLVPVSVFGFLALGVLLGNPLLRLARIRPFNGAEWCVIIALMLAACVIPGPALMWNFSNNVVMPHYHQRQQPGWRKIGTVGYVPKQMLVDPTDYDTVVGDFKTGIRGISPSEVPWHGWSRTLMFWMPLVALSFIASVCLIVVLHGQWAHRERLRYPVADFASELIGGADATGRGSILRDTRFWVGLAVPMVVLLINGYNAWEPTSLKIDTRYDLTAFAQKWPVLLKVPMWYLYFRPRVYFAAIGFAYFVSKEASFSLGISSIAYILVFLPMIIAGVDVRNTNLEGGLHGFLLFGGCLGIAVMLLYVGRRYYASVLAASFGLRTGERLTPGTVWASRLGLGAAAAIVAILVVMAGLNWMLAIAYVLLTGLLYLVVTRVSAETGLFFVKPGWQPVGVLLGLLGVNALGPNMLVILAVLCVVLSLDPRVCLMAMTATALRIGDSRQISPSRLGRWVVVAVLLAMLVGVPVTIYVQYTFGGGSVYPWANSAAAFPFQMLNRNLQRFEGDGSDSYDLRLDKIRFDRRFLWAAGIGLTLVLVVSALRLRFTWWPIHPILFISWGTWSLGLLAPSFLLGWLIKMLITRFGGSRTYRQYRPLFVGLISGEFVAGIFWMAVGLIYYLVTGTPGVLFRVHH